MSTAEVRGNDASVKEDDMKPEVIATSFASANDLAGALRRAEAAHGEHEKRTGKADPNWPDWYARYMIAEQAGEELPT